MKRKEYTPTDFAWTQWTVEDIAQETDEMLAIKKNAYKEIKAVAANERTFENTVYAIEVSGNIFWKLSALEVITNANPSKEIRDAAQEAIERIEKELVDIEYDEDIYRAMKEYEARKGSLNEDLDAASEKLFEDMVREYRRMGFDLSGEDRAKVKENLKRLSELASEFSKNINEYDDHILVTRDDLDGLPEGYISSLKRDGEKYVVSLDYPEMNPFLENAKNSGKRKELAEKSLQKGGPRNMDILKEVVKLRDENAQLLGYDHHGDFRTETRMAKSADAAFEFMRNITEKVRAGLAVEREELNVLKKTALPNEGDEVYFYDTAFLSNELKKEKFAVDEQKIREYFPMEKVKEGMFQVYSKLFSVRFEKIDEYPTWHEDVETYAVRRLNGDIVSYFMLDLYPREGKYGHAAVFPVVLGHHKTMLSDEYVAPLAAMLANFPKPNGSTPSLMEHSEVVTFFHEFGHVMHGVMTTARFASQAGTSVAWDFVEAPSQMLENWAWDKEVLKMISSHYETGESLPEEMLENMLRAKNHMIAHWTMRQMVFALYDMELHTRGIKGELNEEYTQMVVEHIGIKLPDEQMFLAGWGHLMGYDAGYYGYMWSEVYAADMFSRFEKEGVLNPEVGEDYRKWILERGSSQDEMELVEGFLGRKANNEAFLRQMGL